jgi:hypothetical protein
MTVVGDDYGLHAANELPPAANTLPLLHPFRRLRCHDLRHRDRPVPHRLPRAGASTTVGRQQVNGPLLAHIGARKGFDVSFAPFARPGSNIVTLTADVRD